MIRRGGKSLILVGQLLLFWSLGGATEGVDKNLGIGSEQSFNFRRPVQQTFQKIGQRLDVEKNASQTRLKFNLNANWKFIQEDIGTADQVLENQAGWSNINLPHTWNIEDIFDEEPGYYRGVGWYQKVLELDSSLKNKHLFLYFEAANQVAEVFINGQLVCRHQGGYTAFSCEITDFISLEKQNLIAVKVDNSFNENIPPLSADFNFHGGIYRDVFLIITEPVHFDVLDYASPGIYIDTPKVSETSATVRIRGTLVNETNVEQSVRVESVITNQKGETVAVIDSTLKMPVGEKTTFEQLSEPISNPQLWSPDTPNLYSVETTIYQEKKVLDSIQNNLGFRWFAFDASEGFFLNGKPLKLKGTNRHQDYLGLGNAVPNFLQKQDIELIKQMGANFLRLAHYPQDPIVLEAADELGLILWEEIPIVNYITPAPEFTEMSKQMLTEMIRQHYNHPSILMWGYMNEILFKGPKKTPEYVEATVNLAQTLEELLYQEDATRVSVMAMNRSSIYNESKIADIPDVVGWNHYAGWYSGVFSDFGKFLDNQHQMYPNRPMIISEYGADSDSRLHSINPQRMDFTAEYQRRLHESFLAQIQARPFVAGSAIWNQFDFGVESRGGSIPHLNQKGMMRYDRQPKDIYYFYQAQFLNQPVIYIATREWLHRAGSGTSPVQVYSNLPQVELFLNGKSLGIQPIDDSRQATWEVLFTPGTNQLEACGYAAENRHCDQIEIQFIDSPETFEKIAVNVGSDVQFIEEHDKIWLSDQEYQTGSWGYIGGEKTEPAELPNIRGTTADPLYQMMRIGLDAYRFDVPVGQYEVELLFTERLVKEANQRVFNVAINGKPVLTNFDVFKQAGDFQAVSWQFQVETAGNQGIEIKFSPVTGEAMLSGIRVIRQPRY